MLATRLGTIDLRMNAHPRAQRSAFHECPSWRYFGPREFVGDRGGDAFLFPGQSLTRSTVARGYSARTVSVLVLQVVPSLDRDASVMAVVVLIVGTGALGKHRHQAAVHPVGDCDPQAVATHQRRPVMESGVDACDVYV